MAQIKYNGDDYYTKANGDFVTVAGGVKRYGYWNPFVSKFGPHSVYNWETDNLPLYDLEERTEYLWEKEGWSGSSLENAGMALIVVNDGQANTVHEANRFTSLQDAVDALPNVIRLPIIIEVLRAGDLGSLDLQNIKFGKNGSLEIVNSCRIDFRSLGNEDITIQEEDTTSDFETYKAVDGTDLEGAMNGAVSKTTGLSLTSIGALPTIAGGSASVKGGAFAIPSGPSSAAHRQGKPFFTIYDPDNATSEFFNANNLKIQDIGTDTSWAKDATIATDDIIPSMRRLSPDGGRTKAPVTGVLTNNKLRSIKVMNCDGPLYIRGFFVDGTLGSNNDTGAETYYDDYGIEITNSKKVVIENCASVRNKVGGLLAKNSDVILHRRFLSARNYVPTTQYRRNTKTFGLKAINSDLTLSSDSLCENIDAKFAFYANTYGLYLVNSNLNGVEGSNKTSAVMCAGNTDSGIYAISSDINFDTALDVFENRNGIKLRTSNLNISKIICQYNELEGLEARSSSVIYGEKTNYADLEETYIIDSINYDYDIGFSHNGNHNINLFESSMMPVYVTDMPTKTPSILIGPTINNLIIDKEGSDTNGSLFRSLIKLSKSNMDLIHARIGMPGSNGTSDYNAAHKVSIAADNGFATQHAGVIDCENSKLNLLGTSNVATIITGPSNTSHRVNGIYVRENSSCRVSGPCGIYNFNTAFVVDKQSTLEFSPHQFAGSLDYALEYFNLDEPANHTNVEIRTLAQGLVVDNNSNLVMRDLGHSPSNWPLSIASSIDLDANYNTEMSSLFYGGSMIILPNMPGFAGAVDGAALSMQQASYKFTSGRYLYTDTLLNTISDAGIRKHSKGGILVQAVNNSNVKVSNVNFITGGNNADDVFYDPEAGGTAGCGDLRIWSFGTGATLDAAYLSVSGVYPSYAGYHGPKSVYYSSTDLAPADVAYRAFRHFPYGFSGNAEYLEGKAFNQTLSKDDYIGNGYDGSGGTSPYVSSLSILDYFGSGTICSGTDPTGGTFTNYVVARATARFGLDGIDDIATNYGTTTAISRNYWGASGFENTGPFRLYLEPDPICQYYSYMNYDAATDTYSAGPENDTRVYQTISQGYHLSGGVSGPPDLLNTWRPLALYFNGAVEVSGYPDIAELVQPENYNVKLDESAAHTFANAKHCSLNFLGRPALVEIYRSSAAPWGAIMDTSAIDAGNGKGFKSPHSYELRRFRG